MWFGNKLLIMCYIALLFKHLSLSRMLYILLFIFSFIHWHAIINVNTEIAFQTYVATINWDSTLHVMESMFLCRHINYSRPLQFFSWDFVFLAFSLTSNNKYLLITYFLHRDWLCWTRCIDFCSDFDWCLFSDFVHSTLIRWLFVFNCFIFTSNVLDIAFPWDWQSFI